MLDASVQAAVRQHADGRRFLLVVRQDPSARPGMRDGTMASEPNDGIDRTAAEAPANGLPAAMARLALLFWSPRRRQGS